MRGRGMRCARSKGLSLADNEWERRRGEDKKSGIKGRREEELEWDEVHTLGLGGGGGEGG